MSTRTRIVLQYGGRFLCSGRKAVKELSRRADPHGTERKKFSKLMSKKDRLLHLASKLTYEYSLVLLQEPRKTRANRSLYWKLVRGEINL